MSDTPFWQRDPSEGDTKPQGEREGSTPAGFPARPGGESALDPETGAWRPIKHGDPFTVGGHEFRWAEGPIATATFHDDDGNELGTVNVPFDPATQEPDDAMLEEARQHFLDMEHMRSIVKADAIDALVADIHKSGTAEEMASAIADALKGGAKFTVTDDDGSEGLTSEQCEALATEAGRLFDERLPEMVRSIAEIERDGLTFWQQFAQDIIATATLHARDDVTEELGGPEAVEGMSDDEFEPKVFEAYRTGPFITGAMLSLWQPWLQLLGEIAAKAISQYIEGDDGKELPERMLRAARKSLGFPEPSSPASPSTPAIIPAFDADGYGRVANDMIARGARYAFVAPWTGSRSRPPEFHYRSDAGAVSYGVEQALDSLQDAWEVVDRLDDGHADLFDFILAKMLASMAARTRDTYGDFSLTPGEVLDARGIKKHHKGGHRPENIREVISQMEDLKRIQLRAEIARHNKSKRGGKPSRVSIEHAVNLIDVHETIEEVSLDGERMPLAWNLRPGNWTRALEGFTEQYALMMQGLLKLHSTRDRNAKRIGRYLVAQYRIRAYYKNWGQGYDVRTILEGAGIEVPVRNKPRFKQAIETALNTLADPQKMQGPVCIDSWKYSRPIDTSRADWFECWLDTPVIILPTEKLMAEQYRGIGSKKGTRKPKKLAS